MVTLDQLPPVLKRYRTKADDYQRLGSIGVLPPDPPVELIDGEIIEMAPIGSRHRAMVNRITKLLEHAAGNREIVSSQSCFRLDAYHEPQPGAGPSQSPTGS
jgi:Uma2 family endonuclease